MRRFTQVDVFTDQLMFGNPVAVVHDADQLTTQQMADFARWTNLSETTYLSAPTDERADYRVRIFTISTELPFAGHPTLGSAHAWLEAGGVAQNSEMIIQECEAGLVRIRREENRLAFAAPPLSGGGDVAPEDLSEIVAYLGVDHDQVVAAQWADNGPGWVAVMLESRAQVLGLKPDYQALAEIKLGVVAPWSAADGRDANFEVRALIPSRSTEDPVTGSLNAGIAQWLIGKGLAPDNYIASQGTVLGRAGRVYVQREGDNIWIGGGVAKCVDGTITLPD
jgi:PhzF family phenazine biosynthesis protein